MKRSSADADKPTQRDVRYIIGLVGLRYIFCNYQKANCTLSTAARGSVRDLTSPTLAVLFKCTVFNILLSEPHPNYL